MIDMVFTAEEEDGLRDVLRLERQRRKVNALSFQMEGKSINDPSIAAMLAQHKIEAQKCRQIIDEIIAKGV